MKAILEIGDMKIFGEATLYGTNIHFKGRFIKPRRKLKAPMETAIDRLNRNCPTKMNILENGTILLGNMLSYGTTLSGRGVFALHTSHKLKRD